MGETAAAKVFHWLEEEEYQPKEADEPEADFNFSIKVAAYALDVIHGPRDDAIRVRSNLILNEDQMNMLKGLDEKTRQDYLWTIKLTLINNMEIGAFDVKLDKKGLEVFLQARGIFHDALTKDRLLKAILVVHKSITMVVWTLERFAGMRA